MEATAPEVVVDAAGTTEVEGEQSEVFSPSDVEYISYGGEHHLPLIMGLVDQELSEPYSIFTYRYFVYLWPNLTFLVTAIPLLHSSDRLSNVLLFNFQFVA